MKIDFTNIETVDGKEALVFFKWDKKIGYMFKDENNIYYKTEHDFYSIPKNQLIEFLLDRVNEYTKEKFKIDIYKKSERSVSYFELWAVRYKLPVIIYLAFTHGLKWALDKFNIKYVLSDSKDPGAYMAIPIRIKGQKVILNIYAESVRQQLLVNGLKKIKITDLDFEDLKDRKPFEELIEKSFGRKAVSDLELFEERIIDPVTAEWLKTQNFPTRFSELIVGPMTDILLNGKVGNPADPKNARIRLSEAIMDITYEQLMQAARAVQDGTKKKLSLNPLFVTEGLMKSGLIHYTKSLSPLDELTQTRKITKSGVGNMAADIIPLEMRDVSPNSIGIMSPTHSHEYTKIGIVHGMTLSANLKNEYGEVHPEEAQEVKEAHKVLSASELMTSPFINLNDPTRNVMGAQQASQFLEIDNPDTPLVQTGYESLAPHLVSDRFSKKAPCDGKVVDIVKDKYISVQCNSGDNKLINIQPVRSRTKRGVYINKNYLIKVHKGQHVKKDDILAVTPSLQYGLLTPGKNMVVALTSYAGHNFEDGFVVTHEFLESYKYNTVEKITVLLNPDDNIEYILDKIGVSTKPGDTLVKIKTKNDIDLLSEKYETEDSENSDTNILKGVKRIKKGEIEYLSPGGVITDIVIKINNEKGLDPKVKILYRELIKHLKEIQAQCAKHFPEGSQEYIECANSHENSGMLKIGDHKINGVEFPGAAIEYYVMKPQTGNQSSKIVLGATGGKGTVQYVIPKGLEPEAEESKLKIDILVSSLSVFARRAVAVLALLYSGKITWWVNKTAREYAEKGQMKKVYDLIKTFYQLQDMTEDQSVVSEFEASWDEKLVKKELVNRDPIRHPYFPMIVTPFKNNLDIPKLKEIAEKFGIPLEEKVYFPEFDMETDKPVTVGIMPVLMLEHLPESMSNTISMSKKSGFTGQGMAGQKEGKGSLGVGQYDIASILSSSHEAKDLVSELSGYRSDDKTAENSLVYKIIKSGKPASLSEIPSSSSKTKELVNAYLLAAGIQP